MAQPEEITLDINGGTVRGWIHRPEDSAACPAVLVCDESDYATTSRKSLSEEIVRSLNAAGVAAVTFQHRSGNAAKSSDAEEILPTVVNVDAVDDASAVFRALLIRSDIKMDCVGVLGIGAAAEVAACLAGRTADIARLCLVSPGTLDPHAARTVADSSAARNGSSPQSAGAASSATTAPDPTQEITRHNRPTMILHGAADRIVPPERGATFAAPLERLGHHVQHILVALGDHGFSTPATRGACVTMLLRFFSPLAGQS